MGNWAKNIIILKKDLHLSNFISKLSTKIVNLIRGYCYF